MTEGLRNDEAVLLASALVDRLARDAGVRALAIKGPAASVQGLRGDRGSVDVDVLVDPGKVDDLAAELARSGWSQSGFEDTPGIIPRHSHTYTHPLWACEIDVHHWFPGMLSDPGDVFDVLWARRTTVIVANCEVLTGDVMANVVVCALNQLRSESSVQAQRMQDVLDACQGWSAAELAELSALASDVGASRTMRPFLRQVGAPEVGPTRPEVVSFDDWELVAHAGTAQVLPWLVGLSRTPWYRKPAFVWGAVWLHDDRFRSWDASMPTDSRFGPAQARWRRFRRGMRALPGALREYRHSKVDR